MRLTGIIKIIRPVNLLITFISVIIAAVISAPLNYINEKVYFIAIASALSLAAGNAINDILDFEPDKINRPHRVLPSGEITVTQAKSVYIFFLISAFIFGTAAGISFFIIVLLGNGILFLYSFILKKIILVGNFTVALLTGVPLILGAMAVDNITGGIIPAAFAVWINFSREIIKDMEDVKGDNSHGIITFPQKAGIKNASALFIALVLILMIVTVVPYLTGLYNIEYFLIIMVVVNPLFVLIVKEVIKSKSLRSLRRVSNLLKVNMIFGLIAILLGV